MRATSFAIVDGNEGQSSLYSDCIHSKLTSISGTTVKRLSSSDENLVVALKGVEVVLTFPDGWDALVGETQNQVANAGKEAGVKLFVPFEWGHPLGFDSSDPPVFLSSQRTRNHLKEIGLPYCIFSTGPALDVVLPGLLHIDEKLCTAAVTGKGQTKISWLTSNDAARFAATVLTQYPLSQLRNRILSIQGDPKTVLEALEIYSDVFKQEVTPHFLDAEEERFAAGPNPSPATFLRWLMVAWEDGRTDIAGDGDNGLVQGFEVETVRSVLEEKARGFSKVANE